MFTKLPLAVAISLSLSCFAQSGTTSASAPRSTSAPSATISSTSSGAGTVPPPPATTASSVALTESFHSTNPTAVPLSSIYASASGQTTVTLDSTFAAGATGPVSGAPPLPTFAFVSGVYPGLDVTPPIDTPEVQGWINDVKNSGVAIPGLVASVPGGCATNAVLAQNTSRCWWTCGGCTRDTDITTCPDKMTWGLSYDDGPSPYSTDLLNYLNAQSLKSTFFIVGSRAISRPDILRSEYMSGHQLSVHTWSHPYLTTLTNEQIIAELGWTMKAIRDITGVTPNTFRPPYGDIDDRVRAICKAMGLTPIIWTTSNGQQYDTEDWHIPSGVPTNQVINNFDSILDHASNISTGFIVLEHDLYQQTVDLAIGYILPDALARQPPFTLKSIISCLNKPLSDAYIETNNNVTNPTGSGAVTLAPTASGAQTEPTRGASSSAPASSTTSKNSGASSTVDVLFGMQGMPGIIALASVVFGAVVVL